MATGNQQPWAEFNRFPHAGENFFGIVNAEGEWVDSAISFIGCMRWCCMTDGLSLTDPVEMTAHIDASGWSIVKAPMLRKMYEAGLIT